MKYADSEIEFDQGPNLPKWTPKNHSEDFWGFITLRHALEKSRNLMTVRVAQKVGLEQISEITNSLGIYNDVPELLE